MNSVQRKSAWMALALAVLCVFLAVRFLGRPRASAVAEHAPIIAKSSENQDSSALSLPPTAQVREPVATAAAPHSVDISANAPVDISATMPPSPELRVRLSGRVLDLEGRPVGGLTLVQGKATPILGQSSNDGTFDIEVFVRQGPVSASADDFTTVYAASPISSANKAIVVVAPVLKLAGRVTLADGTGIADANVGQQVGCDLLARFPEMVAHAARSPMSSTTSGADGSFELTRAIGSKCAPLYARYPGLEDGELPAQSTSRLDLRIVLSEKLEEASYVLEGNVVRADGSPARSARVTFAGTSVVVDEDARFRIKFVESQTTAAQLLAAEAGSEVVFRPDFGPIAKEYARAGTPLRIDLGPTTSTISGRVVDVAGRPLAHKHLGLVNPKPLSMHKAKVGAFENLYATFDPTPLAIETDAAGLFVFSGLHAQEYIISVFDSETLHAFQSAPIAAGSKDIVIVVPDPTFIERVTGRVVAVDGTALEGITVAFDYRPLGSAARMTLPKSRKVVTGADGTFALERVPESFRNVRLTGAGIVDTWLKPEAFDVRSPITFTAPRLCFFRVVDLPFHGEAMLLSAWTSDGREIRMPSGESARISDNGRTRISASTTRVYPASEETVELVLTREDKAVIQRRAVRFVPGAVTVVKW